MKRPAIILLFCLSATAQTVRQSRVITPDTAICQCGGEFQTDDYGKLVGQYSVLAKRGQVQLQILGEFSEMELELAKMRDPRVNRIMHKHLLAIGEYVKQMKALDAKP